MAIQNSLYILSYIFLAQSIFSQNLVPNPSFEDTTGKIICGWTQVSQFKIKDWFLPSTGTPDIHSTSAETKCENHQPNSEYTGSNCTAGTQMPNTGNILIGFINYSPNGFREYLSVKLSETLTPGNAYQISLNIVLAKNAAFAVNNLGVYFSPSPISSSNYNRLDYMPQILFEEVIEESNDWITLSICFQPDMDYNYMTIGNFTPPDSLIISNINSASCFTNAYYFIDDVSITKSANTSCESSTEKIFIPNSFSPNDDYVNDYLTINGISQDQQIDISIYNKYGTLVYSYTGYPNSTNDYTGYLLWDGKQNLSKSNNVSQDVYIYNVQLTNEKGITQILSGNIALIK